MSTEIARQEDISTPPAPTRVVNLPAIRQAASWNRSTDALLAALEREEAAAMEIFEKARERVKTARQAAAAMRQLRGLVIVGAAPSANGVGRGKLGTAHPDYAEAPGKRWSREYDACRICGTVTVKHAAFGRCGACDSYWRLNGEDRPIKTEGEQE